MYINDNLKFIKEDIENILSMQGRNKDSVNIIAVTKTIDIESIQKAIELGVRDIGENRVQELMEKMNVFKKNANYHMIGHLQTNKVKYIIDKVSLVHSLDRISLAKEMDKQAKQKDIIVDALIQVNVAEEESKFGLSVKEVIPFIEEVLNFQNINIKGLMTIAPFTNDEKLLRDIFRKMYNLKQNINDKNYENVDLEYLSMGMTNDYRIAIEEGSNMVRIGTGIFGKRNY
nr:YggS family pyridoxal phosphate-dependent enzyme [Tissierella creatinophila]